MKKSRLSGILFIISYINLIISFILVLLIYINQSSLLLIVIIFYYFSCSAFSIGTIYHALKETTTNYKGLEVGGRGMAKISIAFIFGIFIWFFLGFLMFSFITLLMIYLFIITLLFILISIVLLFIGALIYETEYENELKPYNKLRRIILKSSK